MKCLWHLCFRPYAHEFLMFCMPCSSFGRKENDVYTARFSGQTSSKPSTNEILPKDVFSIDVWGGSQIWRPHASDTIIHISKMISTFTFVTSNLGHGLYHNGCCNTVTATRVPSSDWGRELSEMGPMCMLGLRRKETTTGAFWFRTKTQLWRKRMGCNCLTNT